MNWKKANNKRFNCINCSSRHQAHTKQHSKPITCITMQSSEQDSIVYHARSSIKYAKIHRISNACRHNNCIFYFFSTFPLILAIYQFFIAGTFPKIIQVSNCFIFVQGSPTYKLWYDVHLGVLHDLDMAEYCVELHNR